MGLTMIASILQVVLRFAQYNCDAYGSGGYGTACGAGGTSSGSLVDTGMAVLLFASVAALIIAVAVVVRFKRRKKAPSSDTPKKTQN